MTETAQQTAGRDDDSDEKINGSYDTQIVYADFDDAGVGTLFDEYTHYLSGEKLANDEEEYADAENHKVGCLKAFLDAPEFFCTVALGNIAR